MKRIFVKIKNELWEERLSIFAILIASMLSIISILAVNPRTYEMLKNPIDGTHVDISEDTLSYVTLDTVHITANCND